MFPVNTTRRSNFPTRPRRNNDTNSFPEDLFSDGKNLGMQIQFVSYQSQSVPSGLVAFTNALTNLNFSGAFEALVNSDAGLFSNRAFVRPAGGLSLPIPKKINDSQTLTWDPQSATKLIGGPGASALSNRLGLGGAGAASQSAGGVMAQTLAGATTVAAAIAGVAVNPFLFMAFQQPNFKEFSFSWTFAPKNERESQILRNIINQFKNQSLPANLGLLLDYPNLALMRFLPDDIFGNLKFKPCAVTSVSVDYTGAGPSFFKNGTGRSTGAPTVVNLTVNFKEIQVWFRGQVG
jgi:hypothetical protein